VLQRPFQNLQRSPAIPALRGKHLEHLPFVIHGTPEIVRLAVDFHEHLVKCQRHWEYDRW
jgi:hypothetical protein